MGCTLARFTFRPGENGLGSRLSLINPNDLNSGSDDPYLDRVRVDKDRLDPNYDRVKLGSNLFNRYPVRIDLNSDRDECDFDSTILKPMTAGLLQPWDLLASSWLSREGSNEWVNTNAIICGSDSDRAFQRAPENIIERS
jgi:hypothetical protein